MRWAPALRRLGWLVERPIAHRGLHAPARGIVENTPGAFAAAMAHDYAIECDLQLSCDGEAMVFHDHTLDRLTTGQGRLIDKPAAALKAVRFRETDEAMPTLGELLAQVGGRVPLVIELKSRWDGSTALARRAAEVVERYDGRCGLMSFDPDLMAALAEAAPWTVRGIAADRSGAANERIDLARRLQLRHVAHVDRSRPHFLSYDVAGLPWGPARAFRHAGLPVIGWTVRDEETARRARRYVDQITFEGFLA